MTTSQNDTIRNAVDLAKQGSCDRALSLLRPLTSDRENRHNVIAAMAFCHEQKGDLSTAEYLYSEALRIKPDRESWREAMARCARTRQQNLDSARGRGSGVWALVLGVLAFAIGIPTLLSVVNPTLMELFEQRAYVDPREVAPVLIPVGGVLVFAGVLLLLWFLSRALSRAMAIRRAQGRSYEGRDCEPCRVCALRFPRSQSTCPHCEAPRVPETPKMVEKAPVSPPPPVAAVGEEPGGEPAAEQTAGTGQASAVAEAPPRAIVAPGSRRFGFDTMIEAVDIAFDWRKVVCLLVIGLVFFLGVGLAGALAWAVRNAIVAGAAALFAIVWGFGCAGVAIGGVSRLVELELSRGAPAPLSEAFDFVGRRALGLFFVLLLSMLAAALVAAVVNGIVAALSHGVSGVGPVLGAILFIPLLFFNLVVLLCWGNLMMTPSIMAIEDCGGFAAVRSLIAVVRRRAGRLVSYELIMSAVLVPVMGFFSGLLFMLMLSTSLVCGVGLPSLPSSSPSPFGAGGAGGPFGGGATPPWGPSPDQQWGQELGQQIGQQVSGQFYQAIPVAVVGAFLSCFLLVYVITLMSVIYKAVRPDQ